MPALGFCAVGAHRRWASTRGRGFLVGFSYAVGTAGNRACPAGAPFLGKKWGKTPGEEFLPRDPLSGGVVWGGCTSDRIPGLRPSPGRPVTARPPAGQTGDVWGRRQRGTVWFPAFSSRQQTTSPSARAGGRAMATLVLEAAGRPYLTEPPSPVSPTREWGSKGKEPPSPWCSFPYFFKEIGPRPGGHRSRPFQRRGGRTPQRPPPVPHSHNQSN